MNNHFVLAPTFFSGELFDQRINFQRESDIGRITLFIHLTCPPFFDRLVVKEKRGPGNIALQASLSRTSSGIAPLFFGKEKKLWTAKN
jgi:hypothetical protein